MKIKKQNCKTFNEIKPSLDSLLLSIKMDVLKRSEAEWLVGLTDSDNNSLNANHLFYCCTNEDAKILKEYILETFKNFSEGNDFGSDQTMVYIIAEY